MENREMKRSENTMKANPALVHSFRFAIEVSSCCQIYFCNRAIGDCFLIMTSSGRDNYGVITYCMYLQWLQVSIPFYNKVYLLLTTCTKSPIVSTLDTRDRILLACFRRV